MAFALVRQPIPIHPGLLLHPMDPGSPSVFAVSLIGLGENPYADGSCGVRPHCEDRNVGWGRLGQCIRHTCSREADCGRGGASRRVRLRRL
jgi:hypothetical protein